MSYIFLELFFFCMKIFSLLPNYPRSGVFYLTPLTLKLIQPSRDSNKFDLVLLTLNTVNLDGNKSFVLVC